MTTVFAYGMWFPPGGSHHTDLTPIVSIAVAILLARFVVGLRLTPLALVSAAFAGAMWAYLAERWGIAAATALGLLTLLVAAALVRRPNREEGSSRAS